MAAPDEMLTMLPLPRGIMSSSASLLKMNGAWKLTAHERIHLFTG